MQLVKAHGFALISFHERPLALVAQSVFNGYSLAGKVISIELLDNFDADALRPYHDSAFVFPVSDVVSKSDILDIFDPYLSLHVDPKTCVSVNRSRPLLPHLHLRLCRACAHAAHLLSLVRCTSAATCTWAQVELDIFGVYRS